MSTIRPDVDLSKGTGIMIWWLDIPICWGYSRYFFYYYFMTANKYNFRLEELVLRLIPLSLIVIGSEVLILYPRLQPQETLSHISYIDKSRNMALQSDKNKSSSGGEKNPSGNLLIEFVKKFDREHSHFTKNLLAFSGTLTPQELVIERYWNG